MELRFNWRYKAIFKPRLRSQTAPNIRDFEFEKNLKYSGHVTLAGSGKLFCSIQAFPYQSHVPYGGCSCVFGCYPAECQFRQGRPEGLLLPYLQKGHHEICCDPWSRSKVPTKIFTTLLKSIHRLNMSHIDVKVVNHGHVHSSRCSRGDRPSWAHWYIFCTILCCSVVRFSFFHQEFCLQCWSECCGSQGSVRRD